MFDIDLIRFVTGERHPPYGHRTGVFQAAYRLWRRDILARPDREDIRALLDWFEDHLAKPERLTPSRHPHGRNTAVSWVRASALEHVTQLRRLVTLVVAELLSTNYELNDQDALFTKTISKSLRCRSPTRRDEP